MKFLVLLSLVVVVCTQGIGDRLVRTALLYSELPLTVGNATENGWNNFTACDPNLGIGYTDSGSGGPTKGDPVIIYFTAAGQIAGMGMEHFGTPLTGLDRFYHKDSMGNYRITVSFREGGNLCDPSTQFDEIVGDRLVVDQGSNDISLPLSESDATAQKWTKGGCIGGMGTHWSYDLSTAPEMSFIAANLFPVVTMYDEQNGGTISAFFITTPVMQRPEPLGPWEGPIPSFLMCQIVMSNPNKGNRKERSIVYISDLRPIGSFPFQGLVMRHFAIPSCELVPSLFSFWMDDKYYSSQNVI